MSPNPQTIGTPGTPWNDQDRARWRALQMPRRSYADEVVSAIDALRTRFEVIEYGEVRDGDTRYPLLALRSRDASPARPLALVTGGVHGYETSGVHGALRFLDRYAHAYAGRIDLLVAPCVSPWAYERVHRWNMHAIDPNRSFRAGSGCAEAEALMRMVAADDARIVVHVDLHETTDSDETEFRPALAARDGKAYEPDSIPDGFYLVGDSENPQPEFQHAIIAAVERVTHIAPADAQGRIIGSDVVAPGVINYPVKSLGLCAGITDARYVTTTEVYPDSPRATPEQCSEAQAVAVRAALDFVLAQPAL